MAWKLYCAVSALCYAVQSVNPRVAPALLCISMELQAPRASWALRDATRPIRPAGSSLLCRADGRGPWGLLASSYIYWVVVVGLVVLWQGKKRGWLRSSRGASFTLKSSSSSFEPELNVAADIVGEGYYQDAIASIVGPKCENGYCIPVEIELQREPTNPHDRNAVKCLIGGKLVGYINREAAPALQGVLRDCERRGVRATIAGYVSGGWRRLGGDEGHYGVKLGPVPESFDLADEPSQGSRSGDSQDPGLYAGRHYTEYVELVKQFKRDGDLDAAEKLLLHLLTAVEKESEADRATPAPWYYEQLAIVYRKQKRFEDEIGVIGRHRERLQALGFDIEAEELARLNKATALRAPRRPAANLGTARREKGGIPTLERAVTFRIPKGMQSAVGKRIAGAGAISRLRAIMGQDVIEL